MWVAGHRSSSSPVPNIALARCFECGSKQTRTADPLLVRQTGLVATSIILLYPMCSSPLVRGLFQDAYLSFRGIGCSSLRPRGNQWISARCEHHAETEVPPAPEAVGHLPVPDSGEHLDVFDQLGAKILAWMHGEPKEDEDPALTSPA
jgi:hypothetical protein